MVGLDDLEVSSNQYDSMMFFKGDRAADVGGEKIADGHAAQLAMWPFYRVEQQQKLQRSVIL